MVCCKNFKPKVIMNDEKSITFECKNCLEKYTIPVGITTDPNAPKIKGFP